LIPSFFHVTFIITAPSSLCHAFLKLVTINSHQMGVARILSINPFSSKCPQACRPTTLPQNSTAMNNNDI
jgi:hypothetical protein